MRILLVVHGYPPRECAGTERHADTLARGLHARGHEVHVVAATRAPGRRHTAVLPGPCPPHLASLTRIVNNLTVRPLEQEERDPAMDAAVGRVVERVRPELVHVHHLQFLGSGLPQPPGVPRVITLHDQWHWCAAGGLGLLPDGGRCPGPEPARCAPCAAAWAPVPGRAAQALAGAAGRLAGVVAPERLHALYQRLPGRLRLRVHRGRGAPAAPEAAARRNARMLGLLRAADAVISPSRFLAGRAAAQGVAGGIHVPHGIAGARSGRRAPPGPGAPFLFLGTIARHKGPDRVVAAWRAACPGGRPGLRLHGAVQDPALAAALGHPVGPVLDAAGVRAALDGARALVMGSTWDENAPMVILEARSRGCPVIAPALGGIPELVDPARDGWLVPPDAPGALAAALGAACTTPRSPRPPPTLDEMVDQTLAVYRRVAP